MQLVGCERFRREYTGSTLRDSVVGRDAKLSHVKLVNSLLGDAVVVSGVNGSLSIGDHSEVNGEL